MDRNRSRKHVVVAKGIPTTDDGCGVQKAFRRFKAHR